MKDKIRDEERDTRDMRELRKYMLCFIDTENQHLQER